MVNAFEIVMFVVCGAGIALCATPLLRPGRALNELGRRGSMWFDHIEEQSVEEQPVDDAVESIPLRPLRSRYLRGRPD